MSSSNAPVRVDLFFDVVSPYSWLAFEVLTRYREAWGLDLRLRPVYLGGIMAAAENRPPGLVPAKAKYMSRELRRSAGHFNVPLRQPADFAAVMFGGTLLAQRTLAAVAAARPAALEEAARQLWLRVWSLDLGVREPEHVAEALEAAGLSPADARGMVQASSLKATKESLKDATAEALKAGAFGAPAIVVHAPGAARPELYFGSDRFEQIAELLGRRWDGPRGPAAAEAAAARSRL